jgi:peptidoglycan/xylan/chitin deacetylase (PgdA/CDA1 family)
MGRAGALVLVLAAVLALGQALIGTATPARPVAARSVPRASARVVAPPARPFLALSDAALPAQASPPAEVVPAGRQSVDVPILMYHYIRVNPNPGDALGFALSVMPGDFAAQMGWLAANGYHTVDLQDLVTYFETGRSLPSRPVVLTFDDGYEDFYTAAYPVLRAYGFTAVAYVITGLLGAGGYLTADQLVQLDAGGIEIGAHTVSHPDLTRLPAAEVQREVADSKAMLEGLLRHPVLDFCYPSGKTSPAVVQQVEAAGFQSATTTAPGIGHAFGNRFTWNRVRVSGGESLAAFIQSLGAVEPAIPAPTPPPRTPGPALRGFARE